MKRLFSTILFLLFLSPVFGQMKSGSVFRYKTEPDLDRWTITHFMGGTALYGGLRCFKCSEKTSLVMAIVTGWAYEIYVDGFGNPLPGFDKPDPSGADLIGDPLFVAAGALFGCLVDLLFQEHDKRFAVAVSPRSVALQMQL
jgi:hypothetical protein